MRQGRTPARLTGLNQDGAGVLHTSLGCGWIVKTVLNNTRMPPISLEEFLTSSKCLRCMPLAYATLDMSLSRSALDTACEAQLAREGVMSRCCELEREGGELRAQVTDLRLRLDLAGVTMAPSDPNFHSHRKRKRWQDDSMDGELRMSG